MLTQVLSERHTSDRAKAQVIALACPRSSELWKRVGADYGLRHQPNADNARDTHYVTRRANLLAIDPKS